MDVDARDQRALDWATEAIRLTTDHGSKDEGGPYEVGRVLARMPASSDGLWPSIPTRELLKSDPTQRIAAGFRIETLNSRGVTTRSLGDGGKQERQLEAHYRHLADKLRLKWPEAAGVVEQLADSYQRDAAGEDAVALAENDRYRDKVDENPNDD